MTTIALAPPPAAKAQRRKMRCRCRGGEGASSDGLPAARPAMKLMHSAWDEARVTAV
jgi:hypothetical protein